jgi:hypothetical protein
MNQTASAEQKQTWTELAENADHHRLTDVSAMDIYNIKLPKGIVNYRICLKMGFFHNYTVIPRREVEARLMESELDFNNGMGITAWLVDGLKIQEDQYVSDSDAY